MIYLSVTAVLALAVFSWYSFWRHQASLLQTSGYVPPSTSWFAKCVYSALSRLTAFLTVGPIIVVDGKKAPRNGRVIYLANHQVPADFAVLYRAAGRHYRALGDAAQFPGILGLLAAWLGVISVTFSTKEERAAGEAAAVAVAAGSRSGLSFSHLLALLAVSLAGVLFCLWQNELLYAGIGLLVACLALSRSGGDPALAIAPQGALMPDNVLKKEEFRAGAIRIARAALAQSAEPVWLVPVAIRYKRDPKDAHWTHRFLGKTRSLFLGLRNPRHWDPIFKTDLTKLSQAEKQVVEAEQALRLAAYKSSYVTSYGAVAVVGDAIDPGSLSADPLEAIEQVRLQIVALLMKSQAY